MYSAFNGQGRKIRVEVWSDANDPFPDPERFPIVKVQILTVGSGPKDEKNTTLLTLTRRQAEKLSERLDATLERLEEEHGELPAGV